MTRSASLLLVLSLCIPLGAGCSKKDESESAAPETLPKAEVERARTACTTYVERVCSCAAEHPEKTELADECQLAKARPAALEIHLGADGAKGLDDTELQVVKREARKIGNGCFEADARLDPQFCPRVAPAQ